MNVYVILTETGAYVQDHKNGRYLFTKDFNGARKYHSVRSATFAQTWLQTRNPEIITYVEMVEVT